MRRTLSRLALFAVGAVVVGGYATADDKKEPKVPDNIKEIMKKGHGSKGLLKSIDTNVKKGEWDTVQEDSKLLKAFGEGLGKLKPEKGTAESWKKLTDKYKQSTAAVSKAAEKKDAKGVTDALGKIIPKSGSCKECHDAHKE